MAADEQRLAIGRCGDADRMMADRDFIERMTQETQGLRDELKRRNDDTRATVERMFNELSGVKTDRNLLAGLFIEIAKCLNQDVAPKGFGKSSSNDHG